MSTMNYFRDILPDSFDATAPTPSSTSFNIPDLCSSSSASTTQYSASSQQATSFGLDQKYSDKASPQNSTSSGIFIQSTPSQYSSFHYQQPQTSVAQNSNDSPLSSSICSVGNGQSVSTSFQPSPSTLDADSNAPNTAVAVTVADTPFSFCNSSVASTTNSNDYGSSSKVSTTFNQLTSKWLTTGNTLDFVEDFDDFDLIELKKEIITDPNLEPSATTTRSSGLYLNNKRVSKTKPKTITVVDLTNDDAEHIYEVRVTESGGSTSTSTSVNSDTGSTNNQVQSIMPSGNSVIPVTQSADNIISNSSSPFYSAQQNSSHSVVNDVSFGVSTPSTSINQAFNITNASFGTSTSSSSVTNMSSKLRIRTDSELFEQSQRRLMDMIDTYLPSRATASSQMQTVIDPPSISNNHLTVQSASNPTFDYWPSRQSTNSYSQTTSSGLQSSQISTTSTGNVIYGTTTSSQQTYNANMSNTVYGAPILNGSSLQTHSSILPSRTLPHRRVLEKPNVPYSLPTSIMRGKSKRKQSAIPIPVTGVTTSTIQPLRLFAHEANSRTNTSSAALSSFHLRSLLSNANSNGNLQLGYPSCNRLNNSNNDLFPPYPWSGSSPGTSDLNPPYLATKSFARLRCLSNGQLQFDSSTSAPKTVKTTFANNTAASSIYCPFSSPVYQSNVDLLQPLSLNTSQDLSLNPSLTNTVPPTTVSPNQNFTIYANKVNIQNAAGQETASLTTAIKNQQTSNTLPGKNESDDDGDCVVCLERSASMVLYKCGHACLCQLCVVKVQREGSKCPICRNVFVDAIKLYKI